MIPSLSYLLLGHVTLSTDGDHAARLLEICRIRSIPYENFCNTEDGGISLRFTSRSARRVVSLCRDCDIPVSVSSKSGLPRLLRRILNRPGLLVGGILGFVLYLVAGSFFWDIRISGNTALSDAAVRRSLSSVGLSVGSPIPGFEADVTENQVLLLDDRLAWLSVNRKGTVAYVEVREAVKPPSAEPAPLRDMVAALGGVIEYVELESGNVRVKAGQTVSAGEVLVSGIYESLQTGIRVESASARVFARTTREFSVTIPLSYEEKRYLTAENGGDAEPLCEKSLLFFGRHIKFSKKSGNLTEFCDIMEEERSWGLVGGVGFPISTRTEWYLPYKTVSATRTYAEAEELAYFELARYIASLPGGATLTGKTVTVTRGTDFLLLNCTLTAIEDIATERVIEVEP
ncbi:MAG: sporulation protein YqfD [Clostridia bacterium]|nr:sporulation protein YqfD [Clostridia bacterium]